MPTEQARDWVPGHREQPVALHPGYRLLGGGDALPSRAATCAQFEDEGLATGREQGGRKIFALTEAGRAQADQGRVRDLAADPADASLHQDLRAEVQQLHVAARQVGSAGTPEQVEQAVAAVRAARQALYRLLAELDAPRAAFTSGTAWA